MLILRTAYAASIFTEIGYDAGESLNLLAGLYLAAIAGNLISFLCKVPGELGLPSLQTKSRRY